MRIFGRHIVPSVMAEKALLLIKSVTGIMRTCKKPAQVINAYIFKKTRLSKIELRSGMVVHLSDSSNDIVTFVLVFCRKEYGQIGQLSTIIDVGANVGLFALYAASQGCKKIIAIEPNTISFNTLVKNIQANQLQHIILAKHQAVSHVSGQEIFIPKNSNPENVALAAITSQQHNDYETVTTICLPDIIASLKLPQVQLLKMDCEGAEFDILLPMPATDLQCFEHIVMEYHHEPQPIIQHLVASGFAINLFKKIIDTRIKVGIIKASYKG